MTTQHAAALKKDANRTKNTGPDGEVEGTCRWVKRPGKTMEGGILRIIDANYPIAPVFFCRKLVGFTVGEYEVFTMVPDGQKFECDCGDFVYRRQVSDKGCKHAAGLAAALAKLGSEYPGGSK